MSAAQALHFFSSVYFFLCFIKRLSFVYFFHAMKIMYLCRKHLGWWRRKLEKKYRSEHRGE